MIFLLINHHGAFDNSKHDGSNKVI